MLFSNFRKGEKLNILHVCKILIRIIMIMIKRYRIILWLDNIIVWPYKANKLRSILCHYNIMSYR